MMQNDGLNASTESVKHDLFKDVLTSEAPVVYTRPAIADSEPVYPVYNQPLSENFIKIDDYQKSRENVEDISHETEEESLSLEKNEKDMIIKALKKNNFKRKYAAMSLGISERTLYRKIKQYDIEDED